MGGGRTGTLKPPPDMQKHQQSTLYMIHDTGYIIHKHMHTHIHILIRTYVNSVTISAHAIICRLKNEKTDSEFIIFGIRYFLGPAKFGSWC